MLQQVQQATIYQGKFKHTFDYTSDEKLLLDVKELYKMAVAFCNKTTLPFVIRKELEFFTTIKIGVENYIQRKGTINVMKNKVEECEDIYYSAVSNVIS